MSNRNDKFEVVECDGFPGLTVGQYTLKPGEKFTRSAWSFGDESLDKAVENKRCKLISKNTEESRVKGKVKDK